MALYPKAVKRLIPHGSNDPAIKPIGAILHVDAGNAGGESLFRYFSEASGGIESHFHIEKDGTVYQYRDTNFEADANYKGNSFVVDGVRRGYISIETQGLERGKWTIAQVKSIKDLLLWLSEEHEFPLEVPKTSKSPGVGYHTLFGAPSDWTPVAKSCPGPDRKVQFREELVPWFKNPYGKAEEEPVKAQEEKPAPKPVAPKPAFVKLDPGVKRGKRHPQVKLLQQLLIKAGYGPIRGAVSTYYGENTEAAVARFHKKNPQFTNRSYDSEIGPKGFEHLQAEAKK